MDTEHLMFLMAVCKDFTSENAVYWLEHTPTKVFAE